MASQKLSAISIVLILLLSLVNGFALQESFDVSTATAKVTACTQSVTPLSFVVKNTGSIESGYNIETTGSGVQFTTFSETVFSLLPGESRTVYAYFTPGSSKGSYQLETTVTTVLGTQKTITFNIATQSCANIGVVVKNPIVKKNPCETAQFSFDVTNTGDFPETYVISTDGLNEFTTLNTNFLFLSPQETKQVDVFVNPSCDLYGQKEIKVNVLAQTNKFLAETNVVLDITQNYDYLVTLPANQKICNLRETSIPVGMANRVPFVNQYKLAVSGPSWITEEADVVELGPYGNGLTHLIATPEHPGTYPIVLEAKSVRGDVVKAADYELIVDNCYDVDANIDQPADIIVAGHSKNYQITIKNEGTKTDSYTFELASPTWVYANAVPVSVNAGETKTFTLTANPVNVTGNFEAQFRVISKETNTVTEDSIKLNIITAEQAYDLSIKPQHMRVLYGDETVSFKLENKGILPATYNLVLRAPQWATLPANQVTLQPGETQVLDIPVRTSDKDAAGDYGIELIATVNNEVGFVSQTAIKLRQLTVTQEAIAFAIAYWIYLVIVAIILLIALFIALFGRKIARSWRDSRVRAKESSRIKAELKQKKKEEKLAQKLLKEQMKASSIASSYTTPVASKKPSKFWKWVLGVFMILVALGIIAGVVLGFAGYTPFVKEFFKQHSDDQKFQPIIQVNTTGLEAYGNTVIVRGENIIVPIIVKNNYDDDLVFDVEVDASWIKSDVKRIELEAKEQEVVNLRITPDAAEKGLYVVKVAASLKKENKVFTEDITLNVRKKSFVEDVMTYLPYLVGGLVLAFLIGYTASRKRKQTILTLDPKKEKVVKIKPKPARKIQINIPSKGK